MIFAFLAQLIVHLPTPPHMPYLREYNDVFAGLLRVDFSSLLGTLIGGFLNIYLLTKGKILTQGKYFMIRSFSANVTGEFIGLIVAASLSLIGKFAAHDIMKIIFSDYLVRVIFAFLVTIPSAWFVSYLKKKEKIDVYSFGTNFNPFKMDIKN